MKKKKKLTNKQIKNVREKMQPILSSFDQTNRLLKYKFGVENINYVTDNGIIQNGWLVSKKSDVPEGTAILEKQNAPVYILGEFFSAIFAWDAIHSVVVATLWKRGKKVDEVRSIKPDILLTTMNEWFDKVTKGDNNDL